MRPTVGHAPRAVGNLFARCTEMCESLGRVAGEFGEQFPPGRKAPRRLNIGAFESRGAPSPIPASLTLLATAAVLFRTAARGSVEQGTRTRRDGPADLAASARDAE